MNISELSKMMQAHVDSVLAKPFDPKKSEKDAKCCLSYWYPKILKNKVRTPKTKIIRLNYKESFDLFKILDGERCDLATRLFADIFREACAMRKTAYFLRTGQTSGKHNWNHTCNLGPWSAALIKKHVCMLLDFSGCVDLPVDVWVLREMLPTKPIFRAFDGMPIVQERRYFVRDGKVEEHFPYWPQHSIEGHVDEETHPDWRGLLSEDNKQNAEQIKLLTGLSENAMQGIEGYWSIDWLRTTDGWYCTDMALGDASYHYGRDLENRKK